MPTFQGIAIDPKDIQCPEQLFHAQLNIIDGVQNQIPLLAVDAQGKVGVVGADNAEVTKGHCPFSAPLRKSTARFNLTLLDMWGQFDGCRQAGITPQLMQPLADCLNTNPYLKKLRA